MEGWELQNWQCPQGVLAERGWLGASGATAGQRHTHGWELSPPRAPMRLPGLRPRSRTGSWCWARCAARTRRSRRPGRSGQAAGISCRGYRPGARAGGRAARGPSARTSPAGHTAGGAVSGSRGLWGCPGDGRGIRGSTKTAGGVPRGSRGGPGEWLGPGGGQASPPPRGPCRRQAPAAGSGAPGGMRARPPKVRPSLGRPRSRKQRVLEPRGAGDGPRRRPGSRCL